MRGELTAGQTTIFAVRRIQGNLVDAEHAAFLQGPGTWLSWTLCLLSPRMPLRPYKGAPVSRKTHFPPWCFYSVLSTATFLASLSLSLSPPAPPPNSLLHCA